MKRSEINKALRRMQNMIEEYKISLPDFCNWKAKDWATKGEEYIEIKDNMLGWDITDFGLGNFKQVGFSLITIRNGNTKLSEKYPKPYAEKLLYLDEGQSAEMHFHKSKMEDIINKGGGNVVITVYNSTPGGEFDITDVNIHSDGRNYSVTAGSKIVLKPGQSITITKNLYHDFAVEKGSGAVLLGEVSMCNDDNTDNYFYNKRVGRFPAIIEDEEPYRVLCNEYDKYWRN